MPNPRIKILTDSGGDIPLDLAAEHGLAVIPFPIAADGMNYLMGVDFFTAREFYEIMRRSPVIPKTAQITAVRYCEEYARMLEQGCTDLIVITIASTASATYENARAARELFYRELPGARERMNIHVVNSRCYSIAYGWQALEACRMARAGADVPTILAQMEQWFSSLEIYVAPYTLEYAKKSGRIGVASAVLGEALGIRPIISIIEGEAKTYRKVRGNAAVLPALLGIARERMREGSPYGILQGTYEGVGDILRSKMAAAVGYAPFGLFDVGPAIALNIGPQMLGIGFTTNRGRGKSL